MPHDPYPGWDFTTAPGAPGPVPTVPSPDSLDIDALRYAQAGGLSFPKRLSDYTIEELKAHIVERREANYNAALRLINEMESAQVLRLLSECDHIFHEPELQRLEK